MASVARYASEVVYAFPTPLFAEDFWLYVSSGLEDLINAVVHAMGVAWIIRRRVLAVISLSALVGAIRQSGQLASFSFDVRKFAWP